MDLTLELDKIATELEQAGRPDLALALDKISDDLDRQGAADPSFIGTIVDFFKKKKIPEPVQKKTMDILKKEVPILFADPASGQWKLPHQIQDSTN